MLIFLELEERMINDVLHIEPFLGVFLQNAQKEIFSLVS